MLALSRRGDSIGFRAFLDDARGRLRLAQGSGRMVVPYRESRTSRGYVLVEVIFQVVFEGWLDCGDQSLELLGALIERHGRKVEIGEAVFRVGLLGGLDGFEVAGGECEAKDDYF